MPSTRFAVIFTSMQPTQLLSVRSYLEEFPWIEVRRPWCPLHRLSCPKPTFAKACSSQCQIASALRAKYHLAHILQWQLNIRYQFAYQNVQLYAGYRVLSKGPRRIIHQLSVQNRFSMADTKHRHLSICIQSFQFRYLVSRTCDYQRRTWDTHFLSSWLKWRHLHNTLLYSTSNENISLYFCV